jgi:hypothetical protein
MTRRPYRLPVTVVRDDRGRLLGWWPALTGRQFGAWLELEFARQLEEEDAVGTALWILHGAAPTGERLAHPRMTPWRAEGVLVDLLPVLTWNRILKPPPGVR